MTPWKESFLWPHNDTFKGVKTTLSFFRLLKESFWLFYKRVLLTLPGVKILTPRRVVSTLHRVNILTPKRVVLTLHRVKHLTPKRVVLTLHSQTFDTKDSRFDPLGVKIWLQKELFWFFSESKFLTPKRVVLTFNPETTPVQGSKRLFHLCSISTNYVSLIECVCSKRERTSKMYFSGSMTTSFSFNR